MFSLPAATQLFGVVAEWLLEKALQRLVLVIVGTDSGDTLERWTFNVHKEERPALKDGRWVRWICCILKRPTENHKRALIIKE